MNKNIDEIVANVDVRLGKFLSENDRGFFKRVYASGLGTYEARLRAVGLSGLGDVLDAGCGFGQWALALSEMNRSVCAMDVQSDRLLLLDEVRKALGVENLSICKSRLETLPYADESFDGILCYGVIFCTDWKRSLGEFSRVLRTGGRLYLSANEVGYHLHCWSQRPNATSDFDPRENSALAFTNTIRYAKFGEPPAKGQIIIERAEMVAAMEQVGLVVVAQGGEGTIHVDKSAPTPKPFFRSEYFGLPGCYEVLARKA